MDSDQGAALSWTELRDELIAHAPLVKSMRVLLPALGTLTLSACASLELQELVAHDVECVCPRWLDPSCSAKDNVA